MDVDKINRDLRSDHRRSDIVVDGTPRGMTVALKVVFDHDVDFIVQHRRCLERVTVTAGDELATIQAFDARWDSDERAVVARVAYVEASRTRRYEIKVAFPRGQPVDSYWEISPF